MLDNLIHAFSSRLSSFRKHQSELRPGGDDRNSAHAYPPTYQQRCLAATAEAVGGPAHAVRAPALSRPRGLSRCSKHCPEPSACSEAQNVARGASVIGFLSVLWSEGERVVAV
jgi:hypothetical protein